MQTLIIIIFASMILALIGDGVFIYCMRYTTTSPVDLAYGATRSVITQAIVDMCDGNDVSWYGWDYIDKGIRISGSNKQTELHREPDHKVFIDVLCVVLKEETK